MLVWLVLKKTQPRDQARRWYCDFCVYDYRLSKVSLFMTSVNGWLELPAKYIKQNSTILNRYSLWLYNVQFFEKPLLKVYYNHTYIHNIMLVTNVQLSLFGLSLFFIYRCTIYTFLVQLFFWYAIHIRFKYTTVRTFIPNNNKKIQRHINHLDKLKIYIRQGI